MAIGEVHTIPTDDLVEHEAKEDCVCGPTCDPIEREDGSISYVWVHHSLDNREEAEKCL